MSNLQVDSVLAQIRQLQQQAKIGMPSALRPAQDVVGIGGATGPQQVTFATVLKQGLDKVNDIQAKAGSLAVQFERGVPGVELSQVMLESQKANVAFRATTEIRNRLVNAYQDIMNMPI
jgi:flagellar hook-basal body complex protein FliE